MRRRHLHGLAWLFCLALWALAHSGQLARAAQIDYLPDSSGTMTVDQAKRLFDEIDLGTRVIRPNPGCGSSPSWLRIRLANAGEFRIVFGSSRVERVRFFVERNGTVQDGVAGSALPLHQWTWPGRVPNIPVHVFADDPVVVYVVARTCVSLKDWVTVLSEQQYTDWLQNTALRDGALGGGLFAMGLAVAAFGVALGDRRLLMLAPLAVLGGLHELASRGYGLWLFSNLGGEWNARSPQILGSTLALFLGLFCWSASGGRSRLIAGGGVFGSVRGALTIIAFASQLAAVALAFTMSSATAIPLILPLTLVYCAFILFEALSVTREGGVATTLPIAVTMIFCVANVALRGAELGWPAQWPPIVNRWAASGTPTTVSALTTYSIVLGFWVRHSLVERKVARMRVTALLHLERDRLESKVHERTAALHGALGLARRRNKELQELLGYVSHDLRAPLATIAGYVENLKRKRRENWASDLNVISQNVDYQLRLIDDLLRYSRENRHPLAATANWISLAKFIDEIESIALVLCQSNANRFHVRVRNVPCYVKLDRIRLQQIITNFLSNAAKFTRDGVVVLCVFGTRKGHDPAPETLIFSVRDTGIGIAQRDAKKIFGAYTTLNAAGSSTGLGLFITTRIAQEMGANVTIKSAVGKGTRIAFRGTFPTSGRWSLPVSYGSAWREGLKVAPERGDNKISRAALERLLAFASDCRYSDILTWVDMQQEIDGFLPFLEWVRTAAERLQFNVISAAARRLLAIPTSRKMDIEA